ncbi:hypothetical protein Tco_0400647 [Tanacetum coccineum]
MLQQVRYAQWRSRFLRYIDTRPNGDALRKCILTGPYTPTMVTTPAVPATEDSPELIMNFSGKRSGSFDIDWYGMKLLKLLMALSDAQECGMPFERLQQGELTQYSDVRQLILGVWKDKTGLETPVSQGKDVAVLHGKDSEQSESFVTMCREKGDSMVIPDSPEICVDNDIQDDQSDDRMMIMSIVQLILFIVDSGCTKHMTGNVSLLCNFVEKYLGTVRFGNDQFAPILGYGDLVQGNITIKRVYYVREFDEIKEMSETSVANDTSGLVPQRHTASDYDNPDPAPELQNVYPSADTTVPSQQELYLLFGPLCDEFFNDGTSRINKSSSPTDNSVPQDTHPSTNIQTTSEPSTTTNAHG